MQPLAGKEERDLQISLPVPREICFNQLFSPDSMDLTKYVSAANYSAEWEVMGMDLSRAVKGHW